MVLRSFIGDSISIDGRMIGYRIETASDYLEVLGFSEDEIETFSEENPDIYTLINQVIGLSHSHWLLRRTSHSCGSLSDNIYSLKLRLINELQSNYNYIFDFDLFESYCEY